MLHHGHLKVIGYSNIQCHDKLFRLLLGSYSKLHSILAAVVNISITLRGFVDVHNKYVSSMVHLTYAYIRKVGTMAFDVQGEIHRI